MHRDVAAPLELRGHWKPLARAELTEARGRLLRILKRVPTSELTRQHSPLMSPLVWDLAHVANYEGQWLLRALGESRLASESIDAVYDAFRHPRSTRSRLELLGPEEAFRYAGEVRTRVMAQMERLPDDAEEPLLRNGFVFGMVAQHEQQHIETVLATLQLMESVPYEVPQDGDRTRGSEEPTSAGEEALFVPGGPFQMGTEHPWAYDNERPAHVVEVAPFFIDTSPVTNRAFLAFINAAGYARPELWRKAGWAHREKENLQHPQFWKREGNRWLHRRYGCWEPLPFDAPVQHVCWYEADAYATWAGHRLPSEAEWEKAVQVEPGLCGLGLVWEWTASDFNAYPGFRAFPYREYSEVFLGPDYKVLRGASWATAPVVARPSFRNWDLPIRRQIFAGFRCARDA